MSVATELQRIIDAKADLKTAIEAKGVTVSSSALIDDYADYVDAIPSGGVKVEEKLLNFYDYEGTLVASYDGSEIAGLTALPSAPDHSTDDVPLTFDGWNWTLAKIQAYHTNYPDAFIIVGANYHTTDGKTHILFEIPENDTTGVRLNLYYAATGTVDWGDGITDAISGGNITHIYQNAGTYHCKVEVVSNEVGAGANNNNLIPLARKVIRVWLASSVSQIGIWRYCINLKSISIPSSIGEYHEYSLQRCNNLECIVLPDSFISDNSGTSAFQRCYNLMVLSYPDNRRAFQAGNETDCYSLKYLTVPSEVTWVNYGANLYSLRQITLPAGITSLYSSAFSGAISLESASLDKCTSYTGASDGTQAFYNCYNLVSCKLPSSLTKIPYGFFTNCYSLTNVNIPNGVTTIDNSAFSSCYSLSEIEIPSSVTSIVNNAFQNCSGLLSITVKATTPPTLGNTTALPTNTGMKIYVPYSADHSILDAYKGATNWSNFASYMEELPE